MSNLHRFIFRRITKNRNKLLQNYKRLKALVAALQLNIICYGCNCFEDLASKANSTSPNMVLEYNKLASIDEEIRVTTDKDMKPYIDIMDSIKASSMTKYDVLILKVKSFLF